MTTNLGYTLYERFNKIGLGYLIDPIVCVGVCTEEKTSTHNFDTFQGKLLSDVLFINSKQSSLISLIYSQTELIYFL